MPIDKGSYGSSCIKTNYGYEQYTTRRLFILENPQVGLIILIMGKFLLFSTAWKNILFLKLVDTSLAVTYFSNSITLKLKNKDNRFRIQYVIKLVPETN